MNNQLFLRTGSLVGPWFAVFSLSVGAFSSVMSEFIPVGVLTDVAQTFGVRAGEAGLMMTLPGLFAAFSAPAILIAAGKTDRKKLLILLSLLVLISSLISALSTSWGIMLAGRALSGISLGAFWALSLTVAGSLVPPAKIGTAVAAVFGGVTLAMIFGVPAGTLVAEFAGWRGAFWTSAAVAIAALTAQLLCLPRIPVRQAINLHSLRDFLKPRAARKSILLIALIYAAHFGTYTFLTQLLLASGLGSRTITWTLLGFGIAGFIGNTLAPRYIKRSLPLTLMFGLILLCVSLIAVTFAYHPALILAAVLLWGAAWGAVPLCLNIFNRQASGPHIEAGGAMFTSTAQIAIAIGSAAGGLLVDYAGVKSALLAGAFAVMICAVIIRWPADVK
jgi:predicted MFS family arabinose efflux permease